MVMSGKNVEGSGRVIIRNTLSEYSWWGAG